MQDVQKLGLIPSQDTFIHAFRALSFGRDVPSIDQAIQLIDQFGIGYSEALCGAIFDAYSTVGALDKAERFLDKMKQMGVPFSASKVTHLIAVRFYTQLDFS
jgi:pentatricopeptide repeat protein